MAGLNGETVNPYEIKILNIPVSAHQRIPIDQVTPEFGNALGQSFDPYKPTRSLARSTFGEVWAPADQTYSKESCLTMVQNMVNNALEEKNLPLTTRVSNAIEYDDILAAHPNFVEVTGSSGSPMSVRQAEQYLAEGRFPDGTVFVYPRNHVCVFNQETNTCYSDFRQPSLGVYSNKDVPCRIFIPNLDGRFASAEVNFDPQAALNQIAMGGLRPPTEQEMHGQGPIVELTRRQLSWIAQVNPMVGHLIRETLPGGLRISSSPQELMVAVNRINEFFGLPSDGINVGFVNVMNALIQSHHTQPDRFFVADTRIVAEVNSTLGTVIAGEP